MVPTRLYFMVREMTKKHLAAINRGRKDAGLKAIRFKKERKALLAKQSKQAKKQMKKSEKLGYLPKIKGSQVCSKCLKKKVGSREAWFQDFTKQKRICNSCIDKLRQKEKN